LSTASGHGRGASGHAMDGLPPTGGQESMSNGDSGAPSPAATKALERVLLPVMDGYELARELRDSRDLATGARLIAVTGYGQDADRERSRQAGFDAQLVKPIDVELLARAVATP